MKHILLSLITLFALSAQAQTQPPTMVKLIKLYTNTNMAAINDYAHLLGFKGEPFVYNVVRNTCDYEQYTFTAKNVSNKHTYLSYNWYENTICTTQNLAQIAYGTMEEGVFNGLISEMKNMGAKEDTTPGTDPGAHLFEFNRLTISFFVITEINRPKYNVVVAGNGW
jgi:hypothetical protein